MDTLLRDGVVQLTLRSYAHRRDSSIAGELVVVGAGEIEAATGLGAEELAPALLEPPAAVRAGAHDLLGAGRRRRRIAEKIGSRIGVLAQDRIRVGRAAQDVKLTRVRTSG
jgi:voltage-gated potassium channel Kch